MISNVSLQIKDNLQTRRCVSAGGNKLEEELWSASEAFRGWRCDNEAAQAGIRISPVQPARFFSVSHINGRGEAAHTTVLQFHSRGEVSSSQHNGLPQRKGELSGFADTDTHHKRY